MKQITAIEKLKQHKVELEKYLAGFTTIDNGDIAQHCNDLSEFIEAIDFALSALQGEKEQPNQWISVDNRLPETNKKVYVVFEYENPQGKKNYYQTMAYYIPYMTIKADDFSSDYNDEFGDYNEAEDEYYTPKGWYEYSSEAETHYQMTSNIIYWMPLFDLPKAPELS